MNVILRPVYNRPEMLYLSIEYETIARQHCDFGDLITLFLVEHGSDAKTVQLVKTYPFKKEVISRDKKFGLSKNILLGMKRAFELADDFVIHLEDDILLHRTYFQYMQVLLDMFSNNEYSVLSAYNHDDTGDVNKVYKGHHYAALASLINKDFFVKYINPCVSPAYYDLPVKFITSLNNKYKKWWRKEYKLPDTRYSEQAGLINRLVDVALIEEGRHVIMPYVNRHRHIGYYGKNRRGKNPTGNTFENRVDELRKIITDPHQMYLLNHKQYKDYKIFSPKLDEWDGTLYVK